MTAAIERLAVEGWRAESEPRFGFVFITKESNRQLLMLTPRDPFELKHEAHVFSAIAGKVSVGRTAEIVNAPHRATAGRRIESAENVEERQCEFYAPNYVGFRMTFAPKKRQDLRDSIRELEGAGHASIPGRHSDRLVCTVGCGRFADEHSPKPV